MISIIIATYGKGWVSEHMDQFMRALASGLHMSADREPSEILWEHAEDLATARNTGARHARGERLVFLDADDWLDLDFVDRIVETEDVLQPRTAFYNEDGELITPDHYIVARDDLLHGNHIVVGAPVNRELFLDVGGFDGYPIYEDWALWLKLREAGATFGTTSGTYNVTLRTDGRNNGPVNDTFNQIVQRFS